MKLKIFSALVKILAFSLLTHSGMAKDTAPASATADIDQITPIITAYKKHYEEVRLKILPEKDLKKRMARFRNELPKATKSIDLIIAQAKKNPTGKGVEQGLVWCLFKTTPKQLNEVKNLLLEHHKDTEGIISLVRYYSTRKDGANGLREIVTKVDKPKILRGATYVLADKLMKSESTKEEGIAIMKKLAATPGIEKDDPRLFAQAKGNIFATEKLAIGCTAPDIVGTDEEGENFKLSDYRGQVVFIHFWGIW